MLQEGPCRDFWGRQGDPGPSLWVRAADWLPLPFGKAAEPGSESQVKVPCLLCPTVSLSYQLRSQPSSINTIKASKPIGPTEPGKGAIREAGASGMSRAV